ncbi:MAG: hypothetical protein JWP78_2207 [Mucilaginibacter sp.]|nr:hypothetical protein [Mucilaginibacter sp.]
MIISDFILSKQEGTIRAEAKFVWEDNDRPPFTLFVQTRREFEDLLYPDPNSFLRAGILNAWHYGEKRIAVDGSLCPALVNNLEGVFLLLKRWYPDDFPGKPVIEALDNYKPLLPFSNQALSLFSGGVDSVCLLRSNRLFYPKGHPDYITSVLSVEFSRAPVANDIEFANKVEGRLGSAKPVLEEAGVEAIPVLTNIWWLNPDGYFYGQKSYGSQLLTTASFFNRGFYRAFIASSYDASFLHKPWGSHPQLDAYYSSSHFRVQHIGTEMTRIKKVEMLAGWPVGYHHMRVCQNDNTGSYNCGTCEKCIRTQLMLEALGKLKGCRSFPKDTIDGELVQYLETYDMLYSTDQVHNEERLYTYGNIAELLEKAGRYDLVKPLKDILLKLGERHSQTIKAKATIE